MAERNHTSTESEEGASKTSKVVSLLIKIFMGVLFLLIVYGAISHKYGW